MLVNTIEDSDICLVVDVHNTVRRAEFAPGSQNLSNKNGVPSGFLHYAMNMILPVAMKKCNVSVVLSAQENSERRRKMYPEYKGTRSKKEYSAFEIEAHPLLHNKTKFVPSPINDAMDVFRTLPVIELVMKKPWETDDAISSFIREHKGMLNKRGKPITFLLMSKDHDLLACFDPKNNVHIHGMTDEDVMNLLKSKFGVTKSRHVVVSKALIGDSSDNIKKAVAGVCIDPEDMQKILRGLKGKRKTYGKQAEARILKYATEIENNKKADKKDVNKAKRLRKFAGAASSIQSLINVVRLRDKLELMYVQHKYNSELLFKLLRWWGLHSVAKKIPDLFTMKIKEKKNTRTRTQIRTQQPTTTLVSGSRGPLSVLDD